MHSIDVERVRADTPAFAEFIHLNHAGASPCPQPVLHTVVEHLELEAAVGGYEAAERRAADLAGVYRSVARLLGAAPEEVALTQSATDAWVRAFWSLPLRAGDVVLTGRAEYVSNALALLDARERRGIRVEVLPDDQWGQLDVGALADRLDDPAVALVALTHVPTQGGLVNPAAEVGRLCRSAGVPFLLDACQSVGQLPARVDELGCDLLSATGRKYLRAPRGTGFLYVRSELLERLRAPFPDAGSAVWTAPGRFEPVAGARRFEAWERSWAALLGLGTAVDYALDLGLEAIEARVVTLAERLRQHLAAIDGVAVHDRGRRRCGIVTFTVVGRDAAGVRAALAAERVHVWTTSAASARFDLPSRGLDEMVRASVHYTTTDDELERVVEMVARLAGS